MTTMVIMDHDDEDENDEKKSQLYIKWGTLSLSLSLWGCKNCQEAAL